MSEEPESLGSWEGGDLPPPPFEIESRSEDATFRLGRALADLLAPGRAVYLRGELGTGKTVLCRGIAAGLGIDPARVRSPSFNLLLTYRGPTTVHHIDLYRLGGAAEAEEAGILESLWDAEAVILVEWAERLGSIPRPEGLCVVLEGAGHTPRRILVLPMESSRESRKGAC